MDSPAGSMDNNFYCTRSVPPSMFAIYRCAGVGFESVLWVRINKRDLRQNGHVWINVLNIIMMTNSAILGSGDIGREFTYILFFASIVLFLEYRIWEDETFIKINTICNDFNELLYFFSFIPKNGAMCWWWWILLK